MRKQDAPPPGWYPDPEGGSRLRYWEGFDWTDRFRAPPVTRGTTHGVSEQNRSATDETAVTAVGQAIAGYAPDNTQAIISEVREAAREEAQRAAQMFGDQARSTVRSVGPLIEQYTDRATVWLRRIAIIVVVILIAYFLFQAYAQASLFDWLGDRIDNVTEDGIGPSMRSMVAT